MPRFSTTSYGRAPAVRGVNGGGCAPDSFCRRSGTDGSRRAGRGTRPERSACRPAGVSGDELVEPRHLPCAGGLAIAAAHRLDQRPDHAGSTAVRRLHPDFGPPPYGIPYVVVSGDQPRVPVTFVEYGDESDDGRPGLPGYPIPIEAQTLAALHRGRRARRRHVGRQAPAGRRSRPVAAVPDVRDQVERGPVTLGSRVGRGVRSVDERPAARRLDLG